MNIAAPAHPTSFANPLQGRRFRRATAFGIIIFTALLAFELFNYSTTDFALSDLLGDLNFAGLRWATILAIAFCGIDFAGIARLFSQEADASAHSQAWYLFGAWLLAATMNAILTWWGVSMALLRHPMQSGSVLAPDTMLKVVPVFVAIMVWLIRILIIGSLSYAGDQLFSAPAPAHPVAVRGHGTASANRASLPLQMATKPEAASFAAQPASQPVGQPVGQPEMSMPRQEPTYHNLSQRPRNGQNPASAQLSTPPAARR